MSDDERTHLILDAVPLDEEEDEAGAPGNERPVPVQRPASERPGAPRPPAHDPERTHLILDPIEAADDEDDADESAEPTRPPAPASTLPAPPRTPTAAAGSAPRRESPPPPAALDDQPTRLFIDPVHLKSLRSDDAGDDQKTHLFIPSVRVDAAAPESSAPESSAPGASTPSPSSLDGRRSSPPPSAPEGTRASPPPAPPAPPRSPPPPSPRDSARARPDPARDERTRLMVGPIVVKDEPVAVAPATAKRSAPLARQLSGLGLSIDDLMHDRWPIALLAAAIVCGLLAPFTDEPGAAGSPPSVLPAIALLVGLLAFVLAWASKLSSEGDGGMLGAAFTRAQGATRLLIEDLRALGGAPRNLRLFGVGQALALLGLAGLILSSAVGVGAALLGSSERATGIAFSSGLALLIGVSAAQFARRASVVAPAPDELGESLSAARGLAALVDLSEPLPPSFIDGHTPLHRILIALAQWRAGSWPDDAGYLAALERHFQRHLPASQVEREKWLGPSRSDGIASLVIDDIVLLEIARGFTPAAAARSLARVSDLLPRWPAKPIILAIFDAPREAVFQSAATSSLVNLHEDFPLLAVRMPESRG